MGLLALKTVDKRFFRLLDENKLTHFLVLILDHQILLLYCLLGLEQLLLDCLVSTYLGVDVCLQRLDPFVLIIDLRLLLYSERSQVDDFNLHQVILFLDGLRAKLEHVDVFKSAFVLRLQVTMQ